MEKHQNDTNRADSFGDLLTGSVQRFAGLVAETFRETLGVRLKASAPVFLPKGISSGADMSASILFTGTVFGEFVLAFSRDTCTRMIAAHGGFNAPGQIPTLEEAADVVSELLNGIVGQSIVDLIAHHKKLSITPPKVHFGPVRYSRCKAAGCTLRSEFGEIECFLYIDRMKLDIASSYNEAIESLEAANLSLRDALEKLQVQQTQIVQSEKLRALGAMAAGVAHEINTPLATISITEGQLQQMLDGNEFDQTVFKRKLQKIEETVERITKITSALRSYASDSTGEAYRRASVNNIVAEAVLFCGTQFENAGVHLSLRLDPENPEAECQPPQILQVLFNLLRNAGDAVESAAAKTVEVETENLADAVEIRVSDSGPGIPEAHVRKIFDPFFTTKTFGKGTGLGLSLAKGVMNSHRGEIFYDAAAEKTRFVLRLPKKRAA